MVILGLTTPSVHILFASGSPGPLTSIPSAMSSSLDFNFCLVPFRQTYVVSSNAPFSSVRVRQTYSHSSGPSPRGMDGDGSEGEEVATSAGEEEEAVVEVVGGGTTEVRRRIVSVVESSVMLRRRGVGLSTEDRKSEAMKGGRGQETKGQLRLLLPYSRPGPHVLPCASDQRKRAQARHTRSDSPKYTSTNSSWLTSFSRFLLLSSFWASSRAAVSPVGSTGSLSASSSLAGSVDDLSLKSMSTSGFWNENWCIGNGWARSDGILRGDANRHSSLAFLQRVDRSGRSDSQNLRMRAEQTAEKSCAHFTYLSVGLPPVW